MIGRCFRRSRRIYLIRFFDSSIGILISYHRVGKGSVILYSSGERIWGSCRICQRFTQHKRLRFCSVCSVGNNLCEIKFSGICRNIIFIKEIFSIWILEENCFFKHLTKISNCIFGSNCCFVYFSDILNNTIKNICCFSSIAFVLIDTNRKIKRCYICYCSSIRQYLKDMTTICLCYCCRVSKNFDEVHCEVEFVITSNATRRRKFFKHKLIDM